MVQYMINKKAVDLTVTDKSDNNLLYYVIKFCKDFDLIKDLVERRIFNLKRLYDDFDLIDFALRNKNSFETIKYLIDSDLVDLRDSDLLRLAVENDSFEFLKYLVEVNLL